MAGVYIKDMKMPECCDSCWLKYSASGGFFCPFCGEIFLLKERNDDCPLVSVPEHGRLVDADALCEKFMSAPPAQFTPKEVAIMIAWEEVAPTIFPADKG